MTETTETEPQIEGLPFPNGFPNPLLERGKLQIIEDALVLRAHEQGIASISVDGASMPVGQGLRAEGLLPILTDYLTHTLYRQMNLTFDTDLMETLVTERLANLKDDEVSLVGLLNEVERDIQRPLFYNAENEDALLGVRTQVSTLATTPASVSVLLMDAAIESAHTLSQRHQLSLYGDVYTEELDLTPVVDSLAMQNVNPRVVVPENLHARLRRLTEDLRMQQENGPSNHREPDEMQTQPPA